MKKIMYFLSVFILITGCDKVECPYPEGFGNGQGGGGSESFIGTLVTNNPIDPIDASGTVVKNILLEDFTGFKCTNCPQAHEISDVLRENLGDQLSVISVHATSSFAAPNPGAVSPEPFTIDLRTEDGEAYVTQFGIFALPSGLVNRTDYSGSLIVPFEAWESTLTSLITEPAHVKIDLSDISYANDTIDVHCSIEILNDLEGDYYFTIALVENEVITAQDDAGEIILDYVQKDVFRGTLNGTYGEILSANPQQLDMFTVEGHYYIPGSFTNPDVPNPDIEIDDCHVVVYVYKSDFNNGVFEVIQVAQKDVTL